MNFNAFRSFGSLKYPPPPSKMEFAFVSADADRPSTSHHAPAFSGHAKTAGRTPSTEKKYHTKIRKGEWYA